MIPDPSDETKRPIDEQADARNDAGTARPLEGAGEDAAEPEAVDDCDQSHDDQIVEEYVDPDVQSRLWLKAVVPLLQLRSHETDPNGRVQFAFDLMYIAACERIARILRADVAPDGK